MNAFQDLVTFVWKLIFLSGMLTIGLLIFAVIVVLLVSTLRAFYDAITATKEDE